ncbi:hypothetical protein E9993_13480 [Labilibacter sediminis]|nr:hypothetical protein E9993_13480 [Labilibacter sediminis]
MQNQLFKFSIADLCQKSDHIQTAIQRDITEFERYGYSFETINYLHHKTSTLKAFKSDAFYAGELKQATNSKNITRRSLIRNLIDLRNRYQLIFEPRSADYKLFELGRINDLPDHEILQKTLQCCQVSQERLPALNKRMVTQEMLDTIMTDRKKLEEELDKQVKAVTNRREKRIERVRLSNELYLLLGELCKVGKIIWRDRNEAFYSDYIIYPKSIIN